MGKLLSRISAIAFDLDGTLIDSAPDVARALNLTLAAFDRPALTLERVRTLVGDGATALLRDAWAVGGATLDDERLPAVLERYLGFYDSLDVDPAVLYPGAPETLALLAAQGLRLGLCTNKPERITLKVVEALGLAPLFAVVACGDALPFRKPDPRHLAWTLERMGAAPENAVMVGDNSHDMSVARALGVPAVAVSYGYPRMPLAEIGADVIIDRIADLPAVLDRLAQTPETAR